MFILYNLGVHKHIRTHTIKTLAQGCDQVVYNAQCCNKIATRVLMRLYKVVTILFSNDAHNLVTRWLKISELKMEYHNENTGTCLKSYIII